MKYTAVLIFYLCFGAAVFLKLNPEMLVKEGEELKDDTRSNYMKMLWFCYVSVTTIGYGDLYPSTAEGRSVLMLYTWFGIHLAPLAAKEAHDVISKIPYAVWKFVGWVGRRIKALLAQFYRRLFSNSHNGDDFYFKCNVSGFLQNEINVDLEGNQLVIHGEHQHKDNLESFKRMVTLPESVLKETIECSFNKKGYLEVRAQNKVDITVQKLNISIELRQDQATSSTTNVIYNFDEAGYSPEEIQVNLQSNQLVIQGEHRHNDDRQSVERSFKRTVNLSETVLKETIKCSIDKNGRVEVCSQNKDVDTALQKRNIPIRFD